MVIVVKADTERYTECRECGCLVERSKTFGNDVCFYCAEAEKEEQELSGLRLALGLVD